MTEFSWEGKYDKDGKVVRPLRMSLPFQMVETVNESIQERQQALELFARAKDTEWRNRLIWGDNKRAAVHVAGDGFPTRRLTKITGQLRHRRRIAAANFVLIDADDSLEA